ncbi:hypothetical protein ALP68_200320 [Pseudomonas ficuserectae]|nr:hypothetical protein ALP68_200320 [Pseudomonas ficuserectae]RMS40196.1 hypothetical protein ALP67_200043 [Pseudomonas ficuserectae]
MKAFMGDESRLLSIPMAANGIGFVKAQQRTFVIYEEFIARITHEALHPRRTLTSEHFASGKPRRLCQRYQPNPHPASPARLESTYPPLLSTWFAISYSRHSAIARSPMTRGVHSINQATALMNCPCENTAMRWAGCSASRARKACTLVINPEKDSAPAPSVNAGSALAQ